MAEVTKTYWLVWVQYDYTGTTDMTKHDAAFEKVLGNRSGSGVGMGVRDIDWMFDNKVDAEDALRKLRETKFAIEFESGVDEHEKEEG